MGYWLETSVEADLNTINDNIVSDHGYPGGTQVLEIIKHKTDDKWVAYIQDDWIDSLTATDKVLAGSNIDLSNYIEINEHE